MYILPGMYRITITHLTFPYIHPPEVDHVRDRSAVISNPIHVALHCSSKVRTYVRQTQPHHALLHLNIYDHHRKMHDLYQRAQKASDLHLQGKTMFRVCCMNLATPFLG